MTLASADIAPETKVLRGSLPLWFGVAVYVLLIAAGNKLLNDPDTMWHVTLGQWILDHRAVPHTDVYSFTMRGQPWNSMYWLSQVLYAEVYAWFGWTGPVALTAAASAVTFALLAKLLSRNLNETATIVPRKGDRFHGWPLAICCPWAKYGCMMPSTTRLTAASSSPASGCKCGPAAEGACCAITFATAKAVTVTVTPKQVAMRCIIFSLYDLTAKNDDL